MFHRFNAWIDRIVQWLVVILFISMVIVGGMQVFNRFILNKSLSWSEEFQKFAHIWIIFLSIPLGYAKNSHIGMEMFASKLPRSIKKLLSLFIDILWGAFGIFIARYTYRIMQIARTQTSPGLDLRMDWVYAGLFIGMAYLVLVSLRRLLGHRKG